MRSSSRAGLARRMALITALAGVLLVSGCGSSSTSTDTTASLPVASSTAVAADFPVQIVDAFGTAVIPAKPERVVILGYAEIDTVVGLGTIPVAFQQWFDNLPGSVGPWTTQALGGASPEIITSFDVNVEQVAAFKPDLIVGLYRDLTPELYAQLSEIAPTLARPAEYPDYGVPIGVVRTIVGQALGESDLAAQQQAEIDARLEAARQANPDFAGKSIAAVMPRTDGPGWFGYTEIDPRVRTLLELGFTQSPNIALPPDQPFNIEISKENTADIDADVVVVFDQPHLKDTLLADPLFLAVPAVQDGRVAWVTDDNELAAYSFNSSLSLPYALDALLPKLTAAVAGGGAAEQGAAPATG